MATVVICPHCATAQIVRNPDPLLEQMQQEAVVCPLHDDPAQPLLFAEEADVANEAEVTFRPLTAQELLRYVHGMGLPEEGQLADVGTLLQTVPIQQVHFLGQGRYPTLDYLELVNGQRVYLGISPEGACIYRVSAPHA
jgi:hypothetical protein